MNKQVTIFIWKFLFWLLHPTWPNFSKICFSKYYHSCFEWEYCAVSQNGNFMSVIYLHFSDCKFLIICSRNWFRFQKPLAIGQFRITRYQDFWDKRVGWFLGFQARVTIWTLLLPQEEKVPQKHKGRVIKQDQDIQCRSLDIYIYFFLSLNKLLYCLNITLLDQ